MTGYKWLREPDNPRSGYVNAQPVGISEHFEFNIKVSPLAVPRTDSLYLGSSIDQLWDGMWGLVRSYGVHQNPQTNRFTPREQPGLAGLDGLPGSPVKRPALPTALDRSTQICMPGVGADEEAGPAGMKRLLFDISVVRACELTGRCDVAGQRGIPYNERMGLDDPNGIVFVRNNHRPGEPEPVGMTPWTTARCWTPCARRSFAASVASNPWCYALPRVSAWGH